MAKLPQTLFGKRLREARERANLPQDKLGVLIGIDESASSARISRYETGLHAPSFEIAELLAKALDIPTIYLYCRNDKWAELILDLDRRSVEEIRRLIESSQ